MVQPVVDMSSVINHIDQKRSGRRHKDRNQPQPKHLSVEFVSEHSLLGQTFIQKSNQMFSFGGATKSYENSTP